MNVILIGYRATGKTTVARVLGEQLGWPWFDSDAEIVRHTGQSIAALFTERGEPAFRELESEQIESLCRRRGIVLAVGGGAVLAAGNQQRLRQSGRTVWLTADPETIAGRIAGDPATAESRPDLTSLGGVAEVQQVLAERTDDYRRCADIAIDTEGLDPAEVADQIVKRLGLVGA